MPRIKNKQEKARFAGTGAISTALDFGILFFLHSFGVFSLLANFISTATAFIFSFGVNKKFTFKAEGSAKRQLSLYFLVTFFGLWVIQPVIIWIVANSLTAALPAWQILLVGKLLATGVTLIWNYFFYSRLVFPKHLRKDAV